MKRFIALLQETFAAWSQDRAARIAAAMAYYAIFALPSLVLMVLALASLAFERAKARQQLLLSARSLVGSDAEQLLSQLLVNVQKPSSDWLATGIGLAVLLFSASALFTQLHDALNTIWGVRALRQGIKRMLLNRALAFAMVIAAGALFTLVLLVTTSTAWLTSVLPSPLREGVLTAQAADALATMLFATITFGLIFKVVPDVHIAWHPVIVGALVTAGLFTLGKLGLGLYLRRSNPTSAYGAASSLILVLLWIYYSAQIFFLGAEFTEVWARWRGVPLRPSRGAVRVVSMEQPPAEEILVEPAAQTERTPEVAAAPQPPPRRSIGALGMLAGLFVLALLLRWTGRDDGPPSRGGHSCARPIRRGHRRRR